MKPAALILALCVCAASAQADVVTVLDPGRTIVTHGDVAIRVWEPTLSLEIGNPDGVRNVFNSVWIGFFNDNGEPEGSVLANNVPDTEGSPPRTPSLYQSGSVSLQIEGRKLVGDPEFGNWSQAIFDNDSASWSAARLAASEIEPSQIAVGHSGYVGYANYELSQFGYVQIRRTQTPDEWRLIGYRFTTAGESLVVENLIPAPGSAWVVLALAGVRRRRGRGTPHPARCASHPLARNDGAAASCRRSCTRPWRIASGCARSEAGSLRPCS